MIEDVVSDQSLGGILEILNIKLNNNGELIDTDLLISFMSPVKDFIDLLYIELKLPSEY